MRTFVTILVDSLKVLGVHVVYGVCQENYMVCIFTFSLVIFHIFKMIVNIMIDLSGYI